MHPGPAHSCARPHSPLHRPCQFQLAAFCPISRSFRCRAPQLLCNSGVQRPRLRGAGAQLRGSAHLAPGWGKGGASEPLVPPACLGPQGEDLQCRPRRGEGTCGGATSVLSQLTEAGGALPSASAPQPSSLLQGPGPSSTPDPGHAPTQAGGTGSPRPQTSPPKSGRQKKTDCPPQHPAGANPRVHLTEAQLRL